MIVAPTFKKFAPHFTYTAFISQSRDGEPLALFTNSHKNGRSIRVRHNAKHEALKKMIDRLRTSPGDHVSDAYGPKGPRYQVKEGVSLAAQETQAYVFPFSWSADAFWQLGSWDKMMIPKPFSRIKARIGSPIILDKSHLGENAKVLERAMLENDLCVCSAFKAQPK